MATSEFPENGERQSKSDDPNAREAWTPTFDGPPPNERSNTYIHSNNGRSPSAGSRRDPRVHPVDDQGKLVDQEKGEEGRKKGKGAHGKGMCCICTTVIIILVLIAVVVVVVVLWAVTGFQFGSTASVTTAPTTVAATATATPAATNAMTTYEDVTAEMVTFDMSTTDSMVSQNGETNTYATTGEPTSTAMESTTA